MNKQRITIKALIVLPNCFARISPTQELQQLLIDYLCSLETIQLTFGDGWLIVAFERPSVCLALSCFSNSKGFRMLAVLMGIGLVSAAATWFAFMHILKRRGVDMVIEGLAGAMILPLVFESTACTGAAHQLYGPAWGLLVAIGTAPSLVVLLVSLGWLVGKLMSSMSRIVDLCYERWFSGVSRYCSRCQKNRQVQPGGTCRHCQVGSTASGDDLLCATCSRREKRCAYCKCDLIS